MKLRIPYPKNKEVVLQDQEIFLMVAIVALVIAGLYFGAVNIKSKYFATVEEPSTEVNYLDTSESNLDGYNIVSPDDIAGSELDLPSRRTIDSSESYNSSGNAYNSDNSEKCREIAKQQKIEIDALNAQIVEQLKIMKVIIGNSSLDSKILAYGGTTTGLLSQSQINSTFDEANARANSLIEQLGTVNSKYRNQMLAILNENSPGCSEILRSQLGT